MWFLKETEVPYNIRLIYTSEYAFIVWNKWLIFLYQSCCYAFSTRHFNFHIDNQLERIYYKWSKHVLDRLVS